MSLPTALLLARVPVEALQRQALKEILESGPAGEPMSNQQAARHLQARYMLHLAEASFPTQDGALVPAAGPCGSCPKRTGNQPELFQDVRGTDICTDPTCFQSKRAAWAARQLATARAAGRTIIDGKAAQRIAPHGGQHLDGYVRPTDRCPGDGKRRTYQQLLGSRIQPSVLSVPSTGEVIEVLDRKVIAPILKERGLAAATANANSQERERRAKAKQEAEFRRHLFQAVRVKSPAALGRPELEQVAVAFFSRHGHETRKRLARTWGWQVPKNLEHDGFRGGDLARRYLAKVSDGELAQFLLDAVYVTELQVSPWGAGEATELLASAKRLRIDVDSIRRGDSTEEGSSVATGKVIKLRSKRTVGATRQPLPKRR